MACIQKEYPSQVPVIYGLSAYESNVGTYTQVFVTGLNFVYGPNNTIVYFTSTTTGEVTSIPVSYFSSSGISFVVPTTLSAGTYTAAVGVKSSIGGKMPGAGATITTLLFSNTVLYTIQSI
jgi:hypothetical protein